MLALNGADIICFSIMGDLRADRFSAGPPIFSEDRWKALCDQGDRQPTVHGHRPQRGAGSCIIDRKGDILAWNEGDRENHRGHSAGRRRLSYLGKGEIFREVTHLLRPSSSV